MTNEQIMSELLVLEKELGKEIHNLKTALLASEQDMIQIQIAKRKIQSETAAYIEKKKAFNTFKNQMKVKCKNCNETFSVKQSDLLWRSICMACYVKQMKEKN